MNLTDRNACFTAFSNLCDEASESSLLDTEDCQYWVFERGYRAAIQDLLHILEAGGQNQKFELPKLQHIADNLVYH
jgi:hypothetical protein